MNFWSKLKNNYYNFLRVVFDDVPLSTTIILSMLLCVYALLPLVYHPVHGLFGFYSAIARVILWVIIILLILYPIGLIRTGMFYRWAESYDSSAKGRHLAIIVVKYSLMIKSLFHLLVKMKLLSRTLKDNDIPFRIYVVKNSRQVLDIVANKDVSAVMVFGHGVRHGIKFSDYTYLYYCDIPKYKHIKYWSQFHCNHYAGKSMSEYLGCEGYATSDITISHDINDYIKSKAYVKKLKKILG